MSIEWVLLYLLLGVFVGFMAGLLGVGGGGILVPILTSFFLHQGVAVENVVHLALGTAMACMIVSSLSSIRAHGARGTIEWGAVKSIAPGIALGGFLTTFVAAAVSSIYIAVFFSLFMALVAAQLFFNWSFKPSQQEVNDSQSSSFNRWFVAGAGIGSVSALAAVGGGFLTIAFLTYKNIEIKRAIGTSAAIGLCIAIAGTCGYMISGWSAEVTGSYSLGFIYLPAFLPIAIASLIAAPYGVGCSQRLPAAALKKIFAIIALVLSVKMLLSVMVI